MSTVMTLLAKLGLDTSDYQAGLEGAKGHASAFHGALGTIMKGAAVGVAAVGTAAIAAGGAMLKMAADAAPLEGISTSFAGISGNAEVMLAKLQEGSLGMVTNKELMLSYNSAAMLVSTTFANQLPDAMGYLSKVSASTGTDMGFMIDSLVKGVGRLSPMILDNLGIQVSLAEATENASLQFGVEADALTKTQIQAGMMSVVLEKLAANTAAMPEVTGTAAQQMASLGVTVANLKDSVGLMLIPVLQAVLTPLAALASEYAPRVIAAFSSMTDWLTSSLIPAIQALLPVVSDVFTSVLATVQDVIGFILPFVQGGLALLSGDWTKTFSGVQETTTSVFTTVSNFIFTALASIQAFWKEHGAQIMATVQALWSVIQTTVQTVISVVSGIISTTLGLILELWEGHGADIMMTVQLLWSTVQTIVTTVIALVSSIISSTLAYIQAFWLAHGEEIMAIAERVWRMINTIIGTAISLIQLVLQTVMAAIHGDWSTVWENIRYAADLVWIALKNLVKNGIETVKSLISLAMPLIRDIWEVAWNVIKDVAIWVWNRIKDIVDLGINAAKDTLARVLRSISGEWDTAWENVRRAVYNKWEQVKALVEIAINNVKSVIARVVGVLSTDWGTAWEGIRSGAAGIWEKIKGEAKAAIDAVLLEVGTKITDLKHWIVARAEDFAGAGRALMDGLRNGIRQAAQGAVDAVVSSVRNAVEAAKRALGIASPSSVAAIQIGLPFGQGIIVGLRKALPEIGATIGSMVGGRVAQPGGSQTQYHFHMAANYKYQSETSLGQDVRMLQMLYGGA